MRQADPLRRPGWGAAAVGEVVGEGDGFWGRGMGSGESLATHWGGLLPADLEAEVAL